MTEARGGGALFLLSHQNHYKCLLPVIERLAGSGQLVHCAIPGEAIDKNRLTRQQVARLRRSTSVSVMRKGPLESILARLSPRHFPRPRRWANRLGRLARRESLGAATVVVPLHLPNMRFIRGVLGDSARIVCIQHDPYHSTKAGVDLGSFPVDLFCVWGEHMERFFKAHGVTQEIRITGAPHLEKRPARQTPFAADEPVRLLYATQPAGDLGVHSSPITPDMKRRAMRDLLQAVGELPQARLTVKLHPADDGRIETEAMAPSAAAAARVVMARHDPARSIYDMIDDSDLVITILSTVAFEAVIRGKPIVLLNYDNIVASNHRLFGAGQDYLSEGIALPAADGADLTAALRKVLYQTEIRDSVRRSREQFLIKHLRYDSVEAQQRICRVLRETWAPSERRGA